MRDKRAAPTTEPFILQRANHTERETPKNTTGNKASDSAYTHDSWQGGNISWSFRLLQIIISTFVEDNVINLRTFYRGNHKLIGVSNIDHDAVISGEILEAMRDGFERGIYKPYPILDDHVFSLDSAAIGYHRVLQNETPERVVINPQL